MSWSATLCPECSQGKHANCTITTLDPVTDGMRKCPCKCRDAATIDAPAAKNHTGVTTAVVVHEEPRRRPDPHPCTMGAHAWAWLTAGGQECARCGKRRA